MKKMLLFDIDGTLLLTGGVGIIAINQTFEELFGISNVWGDMIPHGKTDPYILQEISKRVLGRRLTEIELQRLSDIYSRYFSDEILEAPRFHLLPGVFELLDNLSARSDVVLGLETGNFEDTAKLKLKRGEIDHHFLFGGFGSDSDERKKIIEIAIERGKAFLGVSSFPNKDIFVVGDAPEDVTAGKNIGVKTIAVATGRSEEEDLQPHEPDHILGDLSDINRFISLITQ